MRLESWECLTLDPSRLQGILKPSIGIILCLLTAACANLNSVFRYRDTETNMTETILIDAKQRPITVNTVSDPKYPKTCIARSADALSQAATSANLKIDQASGAGGGLGFATAEQVMSIAFRTQVTEAQQEYLYYLCQLNSNGVVPDDEVSENLRHFQNTMLAMVAVDDLASAAKSSAPAPGPAASPSTDPPSKPAMPAQPDTKTAAVTAAQTGVDDAKNAEKTADNTMQKNFKSVSSATAPVDLKGSPDALSTSIKTFDAKEQAYFKSIKNLQTAVKAAKGANADVPDDVTSASSSVDDTAKDVKSTFAKVVAAVKPVSQATDATALKAAQDSLTASFKAYQDADKAYTAALDNLAKANKSWAAATSAADGKAKDPGKSQGDATASTSVSATTANAIAIIVQTVIWQSFTTEKCLKALFGESKKVVEEKVINFCLEHLNRADTFKFDVLGKKASDGLPAHPGSGPLFTTAKKDSFETPFQTKPETKEKR